jgi:peptide deformylase
MPANPMPVAEPLPERQLELLRYPDPRLLMVCDDVPMDNNDLTWERISLIDEMWLALHEFGGWGLAAPQLGSPSRIIICKVPGHCEIEIINPVIDKAWAGKYYSDEGCLSYPGQRVRIARHKRVKITGLDRWGHPIKFSGNGAQAACIQHEIDHLNGINIADYRE